MDNSLVSIVTVCRNAESTIIDTLKSVLSQTWSNLEYIIVDGASEDKTVDIIKCYLQLFNDRNINVSFVSEKDNGIADAWNKGLKKANGDFICILNADDWLAPDAITNAVFSLNNATNAISYGICVRVNSDKKCQHVIWKSFKSNRVFLSMGFSFTSCVVQKSVYEKIGYFNEEFKIALDVDFLLRALKNNINLVKGTQVVYMRDGGVSNKFFKRSRTEYVRALINNGFSPMKTYVAWFLVISLNFLKTRLKGN